MSNDKQVTEITIFKVKAEFVEKLPEIRAALRETLKAFDGVLEFNAYSPVDENRIFADVVKWDSMENAMRVAKAFESGDPRFLPIMETIEDLVFMGHFKASN